MTEMLTRPLTTENRILRAVSGPDLTVSLGQSLRAVFDTPQMGGLVAQQFEQAGGASTRFDMEEFQAFRDAEREREQEKTELTFRLNNYAMDDPARDEAYSRLSELSQDRAAQLDSFTQAQIEDGRLQTPEALAEKYGELGLQFDRPMTNEEASILADGKRAEIIRNALIEKGPQGLLPGVAKFGAGLAGIATDPLEVATMFIPVVGQAGKAAAIARFGRVGGRVAVGAVEGGVGQLITEPAYYGLSRAAQLDYDMSDSLMNVGLGLVFGGGIGAVAGAFARRADVEAPARVTETEAPQIDPMTLFDQAEARLRLINEQRPAADLAMRQFVNGRTVDVARVMPPVGVADDLAALSRELRDAKKAPLTYAIRTNIGIHPQGAIAEELAANGITPRTAPGLFTKTGHRDLDNLVASEWEEIAPGISGRAGVENGYLSPRGMVDAIVDELQGRSAGLQVRSKADVLTDIDAIEADQRAIQNAKDAAAAQGVTLRTDAEARFVAARMGDDLDAALERLAMMDEQDVAAAVARDADVEPLADIGASRAADIRQPDNFLDQELADFDMMVRQMPMTEELAMELAAIKDIETRAATYAEVAEAAAVCLARTV